MASLRLWRATVRRRYWKLGAILLAVLAAAYTAGTTPASAQHHTDFATITGRLLSPNGKPAVLVSLCAQTPPTASRNAQVLPQHAPGESGPPIESHDVAFHEVPCSPLSSNHSAIDGRFEFSEIPPGPVIVEIDDYIHRYASMFHDGSAHSGLTVPIEALPGSTIDLGDIVLREAACVSGTATHSDGRPVASYGVSMVMDKSEVPAEVSETSHSAGSFGSYSRRTDAAGGFAFDGLPAGRYVIGASTVELDDGERTDDLAVTIDRTESFDPRRARSSCTSEYGAITGRLLLTDGRPAGEAGFCVMTAPTEAAHSEVQVRDWPSFDFRRTGADVTLRGRCGDDPLGRTDVDGYFAVSYVTPGLTIVEFDRGRGRYAPMFHDGSVLSGLTVPLDVEADTVHDLGNLVLGDGVCLMGTAALSDGEPAAWKTFSVSMDKSDAGSDVAAETSKAAGSHGYLSSMWPSESDFFLLSTDENGRFALSGLPAGRFLLGDAALDVAAGQTVDDIAATFASAVPHYGPARASCDADAPALFSPDPIIIRGTTSSTAGILTASTTASTVIASTTVPVVPGGLPIADGSERLGSTTMRGVGVGFLPIAGGGSQSTALATAPTVSGDSLPFTGGRSSDHLILAWVAVAAGMSLVFGSRRRPTDHVLNSHKPPTD